MRIAVGIALSLCVGASAACGDEPVELDGEGGTADADPNQPDADPRIPAGCDAEDGAQCNDCVDNDNDGQIDGNDVECTGALDDDEASFATGISGDNIDRIKQDCFFDGNSGAGDDGCDLHVCCLIDLMGGACPAEFMPQLFDPGECTPTQDCIDACQPLTAPGCDCFGCCEICEGADCNTVLTNPAVAPDCDAGSLDDPALCPPCVQIDECGAQCDPENCVPCPGQDIDDLPSGCMMEECPNGLATCTGNDDCGQTEFCASGCCIGVVQ